MPNYTRLLAIATALVVLGVALIGWGAWRQVTLSVDGETTMAHTFALNVGQFLASQNIAVDQADRLFPPPSTWILDGQTINLERAVSVQILADGENLSMLSAERFPANLLAEAGIQLYPGDELILDGQVISPVATIMPGGTHTLQVRRAYPVTLNEGNETIEFVSTAPTLVSALWEAGIQLKSSDELIPPAETILDGPIEAELRRAQPITISYAGGTLSAESAARTVGEALAQVGLPLQNLDYSLPAPEKALPKDGKIKLVRVTEEILLETQPVPFTTETQPDANVDLDTKQVVQAGSYGLAIERIRVRHEDGVEVSRVVEGQYEAQAPQPQIIGVGTKIVPKTLKTADGTIKYWRAINVYAVSYNPTSNGGTGTATGIPLAKGVVAVDPNLIPYYTKLYIPGYGMGIAGDTGGGIKGRIIDLGYSNEDYVSWHQWVTIYLLWPPPENVPWNIP
jgi:resuscitation-promoting factor RpfB